MDTLKPVPLFVEKDEKLTQALIHAGFDNIPSNIVLDKRLPGLGATYTEIHALRNSIIIEPNVPVITGKMKKHQDLLGIYQGITVLKITKYLLNTSIQYKKILTTPESFWKIRKAAEEIGLNIYTDYFCMFDESERLTQDVGYRKKITTPITDFFQFENKAFVSATPLDFQHSEASSQQFYNLKVIPKFEYKNDIELIITNSFKIVLLEKMEALRKTSRCICIFYNSTAGIANIINTLNLQHQYKVFCSPTGKKVLAKLQIKNVETDFSEPLESINFFTSRFFSALDIEIKVQPDILILTDLQQAEHTMIDPFSEAIQIQGRFRNTFEDGKRYKSLTHITNIKGNLEVKTADQLEKVMALYKRSYEFMKNEHQEAADAVIKKAALKQLKLTPYFEMLDDQGILDEFAVFNKYNEERVKSYYTNFDSLKNAYENTGFFNVDFKTQLTYYLEEARLNIKLATSQKKKIMLIVSLLKDLDDPNKIEEFRQTLLPDFDETNTIIDTYLKVGAEFFVSVNYRLADIKKRLEWEKSKDKCFEVATIFEIHDAFILNEMQPKNFYRDKIQEIYTRFGIIQKATQETIKGYFDHHTHNNVKPASFTLTKCICNIGGKPM